MKSPGRSGSFLWVDPEAGIACACLTDRDFGPWAARAWPRLSDDVLEAYGRRAATAGPHRGRPSREISPLGTFLPRRSRELADWISGLPSEATS